MLINFYNLVKNTLASVIIDAIQDKKGTSVCHIDLNSISSAPSSEFIICQGKTPSQTTAIAENIISRVNESLKRKPEGSVGMRNGQWIIIDYGEAMVHVFTPDFREFYNIEDLWSDGEIENIPDLD